MLRIGIALTAECFGALDLRRAIATRRMRNLAVQLDELSVIDIRTKPLLDRVKIGAVPW
jgi:hypothetical protein